MTEKQIARGQKKIKNLRAALAYEKSRVGFYDDGRGLRYLVIRECLKINDYKSGLNFFKWFNKNFPDDIGYPVFLFECLIVLFMNGKVKEAEVMALKVFYGNTYLIEKFLYGCADGDMERMEWSNWESVEILEDFKYSANDKNLAGFSIWLKTLVGSQEFKKKTETYLGILKRLMTENDSEIRDQLKGLAIAAKK
jgi:hypothetical protein